ncbi:TPD1 protein homolog 1 isoform X2 [Lathyrus oleraceus]|uniref:Uncharacterized protein n=1 Tax=Pisum sativum TaxID=3888 RepID=A0A9D4X880_PEA|nr:TPD1 protein homolog 1-like isoform X2 [Pisum sativum]KAI5415593.1 hypothetical protein KIW84_040856 [Pisum sativum]
MTITNYTPLFFLCFIIPLIHSNVETHSGPSAQIMHSFHEDIDGSKFSWHGNNSAMFCIFSILSFLTCVMCVVFIGSCTNKDISISQSRETLSGIPQYVVQIMNTCVSSKCAPYNIHLHCGWFASARIINPKLFKRLSFDDCLVNGGKPLTSSQIIRFTYSNSFLYPLAFKSAKFC